MIRGTFLAIIVLLPSLALGATLEGEQNLIFSEASAENAYLIGANIDVRAPVGADLSAAGGTVTLSAPVTGDVLMTGGTLDVEHPVGGDVRAAGGRVIIGSTVTGDIAALGGVVLVSGRAHDIQMMGATVRVTGGANGNVQIYGEDVFLSGEYLGDVSVSASDRVTLAEGTVIRGAFRYNAPQEVMMAPGVVVDGGVTYTGPATYVPSLEEAQRVALAGAGVFFIVKALAAIIAAGLVIGVLAKFSQTVLMSTPAREPKRLLLRALLGFALIVLTPVLLILLTISFVGIGVALILSALYLLMLLLAYAYAAYYLGVGFLYVLTKKIQKGWKSAVLGMLLIHILGVIPFAGSLVVFVCMLIATGTLAKIAFESIWGQKLI